MTETGAVTIPAITPRSTECRMQAGLALAAAAAAELQQVREKHERSARVWTELADQEEHRAGQREARLRQAEVNAALAADLAGEPAAEATEEAEEAAAA